MTALPTPGPLGLRGNWKAPAAAILIAAAAVLALARLSPTATTTPATVATSTNATAWVLPKLGGNGTIRLADFRGKPLVVTFFASWCTACAEELPTFARAAGQLDGTVAFVGVNSQETGDGGAAARRFGIGGWTLAEDVDGSANSGLHDALGGTGMPITAFYDPTGKLLFVAPGAVDATTLAADLNRYAGVSVKLSGITPDAG